jgi:hypothetical protein
MALLLAFLLALLPVNPVIAADGSQPEGDGTVKADVMYWEGEELVVKEQTGHEKRLRVTRDTKIVGVVSRLKTGDKIHAVVTPEGQAQSITLQIPDAAPSPAPPAVR